MSDLLAEMRKAAEPAAPPNFRPGVVFDGQHPSEIVTPPLPAMESEAEFVKAVRDLGYPLPESMTLRLVEMLLVQHDAFWHRDPVDADGGRREGKGEAYTAPSASWRYRFKVVPKSARVDEDIAVLMAEAMAAEPAPFRGRLGDTTKVIALADFQIGKADEMGGTADTLARSEAALAAVIDDLDRNPVHEIVLVDVGDSTEGFESSPNADRTNDLQQTEQVRVWRRILWRWTSALSGMSVSMTVISVPSNHCRVRRGKNPMGPTLDDWGIEVLAQVSDIASANPEVYGHIRFVIPEDHQEHVLFTLRDGKVLGVVHGHQKNSPAQLAGWIKGTGRRGLAQADIVLVGHFHHMEVVAFGDLQWLFLCPTNDNGSSWYTPSSGERSEPGILTFRVDADSWFDLDPLWLGDIISR